MTHADLTEPIVAPSPVRSSASAVSQVLRIYAVVLAVGLCCGLAIVCVFEFTKPIIARNRAAMRQAAILDVVRGATTNVGYVLDEARDEFKPSGAGADVFAGFDDAGKIVGLAIEAVGMGYQDNIRVLYGYDPHKQAIVGLKVLESRETPGLGDRIEKDAKFVANFRALDVTVAGGELAHPIEFVKSGEKSQAWQIDGITGATISSEATAMMLRESTSLWMPKIQSQLAAFDQEDR